MKLAAAVVWYDEPLGSLERCITSLRDVVEVLVIADGRWKLFDDDTAPVLSPVDQRRLVQRLAECFERRVVLLPGSVWESQVEKRDVVYSTASSFADWTLVIDADEHVEMHDRAGLRDTLEQTDRLTARIASRTMYGPQAPAGVALQPRLFSSAAGWLGVDYSHNGVRARRTGEWLAGDPAYVTLAPHVDVGEHLRIYHEQGANRPVEREQRDRAYRAARRRQGVEGWPRRRNRA